MRKSRSLLLLALLAGWGLQSCSYNNVEDLEKGNLCFETEILPIFISNCASPGCHNGTDKVDGRDYSNYEGIVSDVKKGRPAASRVIEVMKDFTNQRMPPPPREKVPDEQIAAVEAWIDSGARLRPDCATLPSCDSLANVSFLEQVSPIIKLKCEGCHTTTAPSGNIELDSFTFVQAYALSGSLLGSINGDPNYVAMPWNAAPLNDCEIKTIRIWIEEGAQDN